MPIRICPEGFENPWPCFEFNVQVLGCRTSHNSDSRKAGAQRFQPNLVKNVADPRSETGRIGLERQASCILFAFSGAWNFAGLV